MTAVADRYRGARSSDRSGAAAARRRRGWRAAGRRRGRRRHPLLRLAWLAVLAVTAYLAITFAQVWAASHQNDTSERQAIVVMGAAQYTGKPSPVLEARLQHALDLYQRGVAPRLVVTGGRQRGDKFTEATTGEQWLLRHGVPLADIQKEVDGHDTWESLSAVALFLHREHIRKVVIVSDGYHSKRLVGIARNLDLDPHVSPARSGVSDTQELRALGRETIAVGAGRLIGYRRLSRLMH
jgi:vancomycin permeability regulator SanA